MYATILPMTNETNTTDRDPAADLIEAFGCPYCGGLLLDAERTRIHWNHRPEGMNLPAHAACAAADEDVEYAAPAAERRVA